MVSRILGSSAPIISGLLPRTDNEHRLTAEWLQREGIYVPLEVAHQAVQTVALEAPFRPVRAYLEGLVYDGQPRLNQWLTTYLGVVDSKYSRAVGARWMISAVARIYRPGAKVDCCLILEGPQGLRKSTALKTLAEPWFTDDIAELGSKDAAMQTRGVWVIELAELDSMTRTDVSRTKAFMRRATDRFRPPYGRRTVESPRQCVFAGSVNPNSYLRDETGARRFWPVACGRIDVDALARDRDQLWAEARYRFKAGEPWWLDTPDLSQAAGEEQASRYEPDPWDEKIQDWVATRDEVSVPEILEFCLGKKTEQWTQ